MMISRRNLLITALMAAPVVFTPGVFAAEREQDIYKALAALERRHGGQLGVSILDTGSMKEYAHRGRERFAMCSTFKTLAAAFVLARVDKGEESLDRHIAYTKGDLIAHSPVTEKHVDAGMRLGDLCAATVTQSDNAAANLILAGFGGPAALTAWLRTLGDDTTRLDRNEPALNENADGDPRDTTTPHAMSLLMHTLLFGDALHAESRTQLASWLIDCRTGDTRLRAGLPAGWRVGDKTGTGSKNTANDVAVIWPPSRAPMIISAYYTRSDANVKDRDAVLADVARLAAAL